MTNQPSFDRFQSHSQSHSQSYINSDSESPQTSTPAISEADVLITDALASRPARSPELAAENQSLRTLARHLMDDPQALLKTLVNLALNLCHADTAGASLIETAPNGESIVRWVAIAGALESLEGIPVDSSSGSTALACQQPQLYRHPERYFTNLQHLQVSIGEGLLIPLCVDDRPLGSLWILSHDQAHQGAHQFDAEDQRLMMSLGEFTASALHTMQHRAAIVQREQETQIQQQRIEAALLQSQAFNQRILDSSDDCIKVLDLEGRILYMSPGGKALLGIKDITPFLTTSWVEFWQGADRQAAVQAIDRAKAGEACIFQGYRPTLTGEPKWWDSKVSPIRNTDGKIDRLLCISRDITERRQIEAKRKQAEDQLRESEERYRTIVNQAVTGVVYCSLDDKVILVNQKYCDITGYSAEELSQLRKHEITHPDDLPRNLDLYNRLIAESIPFQIEKRYIRKDGSIVWVSNHVSFIRDRDGNPESLVAIVLDITDRKQAEAILRQSEERYRTLFDSIDDGFCILEMLFDQNNVPIDYRFLEVNPAFEKQTGLKQAVGKTARQLVPNLEDFWIEAYGKVALTGEPLRFENSSQPMNRWFEVYACRVGQSQSRNVAVLFKEVSDRKRAEAELRQTAEALHQSESRLRLILESATEYAIFTSDMAGYITSWNSGAQRILGYQEAEIVGQLGQILFTPEDLAQGEVERERQKALEKGQAENERWHVRQDGSYFWASGLMMPLYDEANQVQGFLKILRDMTVQKQAEAQRAQLLTREQAAREEAERANRVKDEFLAVLSHELRSPLNPILGWAKLLRTGKLDAAKTAQALATIERNAKLQSELIEDLLDVSRILRGKLSLTVAPVNLASTIRAALETVRLAAEAKLIQVQANLDPEVGLVAGDATRLQQVVWNLVSNAVKFTSEGGQVNVRLERLGSYAQLTIRDTGQGIAPDFLPYVFDYFRQANAATTRKFGGLGLGLAIVRHLVELHGGSVGVESLGEGQGATFTVRLPLMLSASNAEQSGRLPEKPLNLEGIKVLVVDDETDSRDFTAFLLEQHGAQVTAVASAREALIVLAQSPPDVLLSDIGMPEMDGYMLIQEMRRELPPKAQIPAIALTAYAGELNQQQAIAAGFQHHLAKPVEPNQVVKLIAELIAGKSTG